MLTRATLKRAANRALTARYKKTWTKGRGKRVTCAVAEFLTDTGRCKVAWRAGRYRYKGTVKVQARVNAKPVTRLAVRRSRTS